MGGSSEGKTSEDKSGRSSWTEKLPFVPTVVLLVAVGWILLAGAFLRPERVEVAPPEARPLPSEPPQPPPRMPIASPPPAEAPADVAEDLARRAQRDSRRLSSSTGKYTAQLAVVCDPDNARRSLKRGGTASSLFLLPCPEQGPDCYRLCWGSYATRREASSAADVPASLRPASGPPAVKSIVEVAR
jgi:septal ring-binding cell division protein DamX